MRSNAVQSDVTGSWDDFVVCWVFFGNDVMLPGLFYILASFTNVVCVCLRCEGRTWAPVDGTYGAELLVRLSVCLSLCLCLSVCVSLSVCISVSVALVCGVGFGMM